VDLTIAILQILPAVAAWFVVLAIFVPGITKSWRSGYRPTRFGWAVLAAMLGTPIVLSVDATSELWRGASPPWLNALSLVGTIVFVAQMSGLLSKPARLRLRADVRTAVDEGHRSLMRGYEGDDPETAYRWAVRHYEHALMLAPKNAGVMKGYAQALYYLSSVLPLDAALATLEQAEAMLRRVKPQGPGDETESSLELIREYRRQLSNS
jgi:hypothetical protein